MPQAMLYSQNNMSILQLATFARVCTTPFNKPAVSAYTECDEPEENYKKDVNLVKSLYKKGHWSVFEHATMTFLVTCSRACSLQLARHRHISRTEMSQRYVKFFDNNSVQIEIPPGLTLEQRYKAEQIIKNLFWDYRTLVEGLNMLPEDARMILPEATTTRMFITLNLRTLLELRDKRMNNPGAQWEIRELVRQMWNCLPDDLKDCLSDENTSSM